LVVIFVIIFTIALVFLLFVFFVIRLLSHEEDISGRREVEEV